jgi:hypothetical protein
MAGKGKKTFVAGEVLLAQDVNDYLMDQSVMNFATVAARSSAIPTPTEGMTSYIATTGTASIPQIETYTGSAWQTPYGMTLIANASFTASPLITVSNVFSSAYENYRVEITISAATSTSDVNVKLAAGTGTNYTYGYINLTSAATQTTAGSLGLSTAGVYVGSIYTGFRTNINFNLYSPNLPATTLLNGVDIEQQTGTVSVTRITSGAVISSVQYTDLLLSSVSGNLTGTVRVYGLRNS